MIEKRKPAIRQRPIQVKFFVDEKELSLIKARMAQLGIENMSAYLRKMAIDGYAAKPDLLAILQGNPGRATPDFASVATLAVRAILRLPC